MILLFTDYGQGGPWVGQLHTALAQHGAPGPVIDLMHDAPVHDAVASAHLLAALVARFPADAICVAVVDPGVGGDRQPVVMQADGVRFVGPDNGLFDVVAARATDSSWWRITREPEGTASTFHGRDLFAPVAAGLARGDALPGERLDRRLPDTAANDLARIIYIDHFGNGMTGLRPPEQPALLRVGETLVQPGRIFADFPPDALLWLVNSLGYVEIAANRASAAHCLDLSVGTPVAWMNA